MSAPNPSSVLRFPCPACGRELTLPANLVLVEGPCPMCSVRIVGPHPEMGVVARLAEPVGPLPPVVQAAPVPQQQQSLPLPPQQVPRPHQAPLPRPMPPQQPAPMSRPASSSVYPGPMQTPPPAVEEPEVRRVWCLHCRNSLDVAHGATVPGAPCPICGQWVDLREPVPTVPPHQGAAPPVAPPPSPDSRPRPFGDKPLPEVRKEKPPTDPYLEPEKFERREVKRVKKRRVLPKEFHVSTSGSLDQSMRTKRFPSGGQESTEGFFAKTFPILLGLMIPILGGLYLLVKMDLVKLDRLKYWKTKPPLEEPVDGDAVLRGRVESTSAKLAAEQKVGFERARDTLESFFAAPTWEEASAFLDLRTLAPGSHALAELEGYPRENVLGKPFELMRTPQRIPRTDRFVYTLRYAPLAPSNEVDREKAVYAVVEDSGEGLRIHAAHLYQTWKQTAARFLETPGADPGRFYLYVALADESAEESLVLPDDGDYVKLRLLDFFGVNNKWINDAYVKRDSLAGTRMVNKLNELQWSSAILDLEWRQGPTGDSFLYVEALESSNWGDFPL